jgi:hypothetical protein
LDYFREAEKRRRVRKQSRTTNGFDRDLVAGGGGKAKGRREAGLPNFDGLAACQ